MENWIILLSFIGAVFFIALISDYRNTRENLRNSKRETQEARWWANKLRDTLQHERDEWVTSQGKEAPPCNLNVAGEFPWDSRGQDSRK